ncbi:response regulator transcription factor [Sorangium sp. So ce341]|uniref:helix-turn-helix transcriptional regulator n=1 Tax=Sorangium sp. So ce341 TaxID=3133302 RepID=UPI003F624D99
MNATITELALVSASLGDFERELLQRLQPVIGFETACAVWSGFDGAVRHVTALHYDEAQLRRDFPRFMGELSEAEMARFAAPEAALDAEVIAPARRDRLAVYRELLVPLGVSSFVTNVWHARPGCLGFHFGRAGRARPFRARELDLLRRIAPGMKLAQAFLASEHLARDADARDAWADAWGLSARERDIVRLVARGLRNAEIAELLRVSPNTVRNHLAAAFRKADVTTRTELVALMATADPSERPGRGRGERRWGAHVARLHASRLTGL